MMHATHPMMRRLHVMHASVMGRLHVVVILMMMPTTFYVVVLVTMRMLMAVFVTVVVVFFVPHMLVLCMLVLRVLVLRLLVLRMLVLRVLVFRMLVVRLLVRFFVSETSSQWHSRQNDGKAAANQTTHSGELPTKFTAVPSLL
ncbi:MAG: hypothetical protein WAK37_17890 [Pseudolabrys sp.]